MCKKQTSVSHSSTQSEVISLDAGLRMDGIPALDLWDLVFEVLHAFVTKFRATWTVPNNQGNTQATKSRSKRNEMIWIWSMSIMLPQTQNLLVQAPCFISSRKLKR